MTTKTRQLTNVQIAALHEMWQKWRDIQRRTGGDLLSRPRFRQMRTMEALVDLGYLVHTRHTQVFELTAKTHDTAHRLSWRA